MALSLLNNFTNILPPVVLSGRRFKSEVLRDVTTGSGCTFLDHGIFPNIQEQMYQEHYAMFVNIQSPKMHAMVQEITIIRRRGYE